MRTGKPALPSLALIERSNTSDAVAALGCGYAYSAGLGSAPNRDGSLRRSFGWFVDAMEPNATQAIGVDLERDVGLAGPERGHHITRIRSPNQRGQGRRRVPVDLGNSSSPTSRDQAPQGHIAAGALSKTETSLPAGLAVTMSGVPSPLTSPTADFARLWVDPPPTLELSM